MSKIGILGGSFDPIHLGHLRSAEEVREAFALDRVYFVPAANPPHKPNVYLTDGSRRLRMVELAVAGNPSFRASAIEIQRGGTSYSVDTLLALREVEPDASLYFILGMDAFREIHTWRDAARIFEIANVVVTSRPPQTAEPSVAHLPVAAQNAFCYYSATRSYRHRNGTALHFLLITGLDISATAIRSHRHDGRSIRYLVAPEVEQYIHEHGLYARGAAVT